VVRRMTSTSKTYWIALMLMTMLAMIAVATMGVFAFPASAQSESDCPAGTLPITVVQASQ
jgi:hypothetical protein